MRRLWIGLGILIGLLVVGLWSMERMEDIHSVIASELTQAAAVLQEENWSRADALMASARKNWERHWKFTASMADHTTLDEVDGTFAQLEVYRLRREPTACAATCARLAEQVAALEEAYLLNWWNIL